MVPSERNKITELARSTRKKIFFIQTGNVEEAKKRENFQKFFALPAI